MRAEETNWSEEKGAAPKGEDLGGLKKKKTKVPGLLLSKWGAAEAEGADFPL